MAETNTTHELPVQLDLDLDLAETDTAADATEVVEAASGNNVPQGRRKSLRDVFSQQAIVPVTRTVPEIRLSAEPTRVVLFTDMFEEAGLHYEEDPSIRSYFHCPDFLSPKAGCPYCFLGLTRSEVILLPALLVKTREVGVLRIANSEGPHRLLSMLRPHIEDPAIERKIVAISRNTNRYTVQVQTVRDGVDLGADQILSFLDQYERGMIQLTGSFSTFSVAELRQVPTVANQLDVVENVDPDSECAPPSPRKLATGRGGERR